MSEIALPAAAEAAPPRAEPPSDEALAIAAQRGGTIDFEELVRRHERAAFAVAFRILRRADDAEDAAQEAFVKAWRALPSYDPRRPFRPWLLRIAANAALSAARSRGREPLPLEEEHFSIPAPLPPDQADSERLAACVHAAVAALPPEHAALFQLRYREELTVEQIGGILGRKPGTVAVALHRLRERIRAMVFRSDTRGDRP